MDNDMKPIPLFRSSGATGIEARWTPGGSWVRTRIHNAIRRIIFFLRLRDGVEASWKRWNHAKGSEWQSENERRVPAGIRWDRLKRFCFNRIPELSAFARRNERRLDERGTLPLDSVPLEETESPLRTV